MKQVQRHLRMFSRPKNVNLVKDDSSIHPISALFKPMAGEDASHECGLHRNQHIYQLLKNVMGTIFPKSRVLTGLKIFPDYFSYIDTKNPTEANIVHTRCRCKSIEMYWSTRKDKLCEQCIVAQQQNPDKDPDSYLCEVCVKSFGLLEYVRWSRAFDDTPAGFELFPM